MKLLTVLVGLFLALFVSACAVSPDVSAVTQVVNDSERAAQNALQGHGSVSDVQQYFATTLEGGNIDTEMVHHIAYSAPLVQPQVQSIRLDKFAISAVTVDSGNGNARVMYQIDITATNNGVAQTTTVTQNLLLIKTSTRGWRIQGADGAEATTDNGSAFLSNLMGQ